MGSPHRPGCGVVSRQVLLCIARPGVERAARTLTPWDSLDLSLGYLLPLATQATLGGSRSGQWMPGASGATAEIATDDAGLQHDDPIAASMAVLVAGQSDSCSTRTTMNDPRLTVSGSSRRAPHGHRPVVATKRRRAMPSRSSADPSSGISGAITNFWAEAVRMERRNLRELPIRIRPDQRIWRPFLAPVRQPDLARAVLADWADWLNSLKKKWRS
jgi:hypothetical protein